MTATQKLSHVGLVLAPRRTAARRLLQALLPMGLLVVGAGAGYVSGGATRPGPPAAAAGPAPDVVRLHRELDEARAALRLAGAHGQGLEQQIDALNHRLREAIVELTFVKKAREARER